MKPLLSVACVVLFGEASSLRCVGSKALPCIFKYNKESVSFLSA